MKADGDTVSSSSNSDGRRICFIQMSSHWQYFCFSSCQDMPHFESSQGLIFHKGVLNSKALNNELSLCSSVMRINPCVNLFKFAFTFKVYSWEVLWKFYTDFWSFRVQIYIVLSSFCVLLIVVSYFSFIYFLFCRRFIGVEVDFCVDNLEIGNFEAVLLFLFTLPQ